MLTVCAHFALSDFPASIACVNTQRSIGAKRGMLQLPPLDVRPSFVPHGGLGVFAVKDIKKGTWLSEYGGEVIDVEEARHRRGYGGTSL